MLTLPAILGCLAIGIYLFIRQPKFGRLPDGARLDRIKSSPHYIDGQFRNLVPTPYVTGGKGLAGMLFEYLFVPKERLKPSGPLPSVKTGLRELDINKDIVVWLGHSSFFMQLGGKRILVDPVFSSHASPFFFSTRSFEGMPNYVPGDMPEIDYLIISHDHWDHLDYPTVTTLKSKIKKVICGLGVGAHLEYWGVSRDSIIENDWFTTLEPEKGFFIHVLPARHFSGRLLSRNKTQWISCVLETPQRRIFYSGDSGYGPQIQEIGEKFGGFDLAVINNGQYDKSWKHSHMTPEEVVQAAEELRAKALLPVHAGKFAIANHSWDDSLKRVAEASKHSAVVLLTPKVGEPVYLDDEPFSFSQWWEGIE